MMTVEQNIREILKCYFTGFKDEIIDSAVERILNIKHPNLIITQDGDIREIHDCEKCELRKGWENVGKALALFTNSLDIDTESVQDKKMTNKEKFEEIFGYSPEKDTDLINCLIPVSVCEKIEGGCSKCPFYGWWDKEYKPCFKLREDLK